MTAPAYPEPGRRRLITFSVLVATMMTSLDMTIANVALPHIQGSVSASQEEIIWVLTSYMVAAAIFTPVTGWLASRFGQKRVMMLSIIGFTFVSGLCGIANNLSELVLFRILQGVCGAALVPISQAVLLDINPPERHGPAMAIWGMGAIVGPIIGPALGGWLTDNFSWRWVFYINVPFGVLSCIGLASFASARQDAPPRFDFVGFGLLAIAIASFQLMFDRGQQQDWFSSTEICIEAAFAAFFFYFFLVHTLTTDRPFVDIRLFKDRNFVVGCIFGMFMGAVLFSVLALLPPMLEGLMGYPVVLTGLVTAPRGIGTMISMYMAGQLVRRLDVRIPLFAGLLIFCVSSHMMTGFSLQMDERLVITSAFVQGLASGLVFLSISTLVFASLDQRFRNEGAAIFTLLRSIGGTIGIAVLQAMTIRNSATVHARLVEGVRPDNPVMAWRVPDFDFTLPSAVARLNAEITRQASMVAYIDSFWMLFAGSIAVMPLLLLARPPKRRPGEGDAPVIHLD
ncbi:DHA2 family multidrug resistance protein [Sphingobium wenxiniae]|uniref:Major facilitator superfamily (MFS) profile domain-containing protein n=2 Tax=Sphingobium TaxID=165695 RepID=T0GHA5_9SPHN|nr:MULTISPECIES: DHA2 family efflux MFS transporter permease subunit [Sphingobium]EQA99412.1 hypothetical protein L485_15210 [Sphingobium baderi LL03]KMS61133.1 DSBA oxidoreductase [Sphingobium baderi LL03]MBB6190305.1 DHA2 family multidrug resistance protein [Sphingobium wenxiniae]TWH95024.1 DHA2 family multidrug resistance protein [Sphingobium wenxiniae]